MKKRMLMIIILAMSLVGCGSTGKEGNTENNGVDNSTGGNETTTNNNEAFSESLKKITFEELKKIATSEGFNWNTLSSVYNLKKEYIDVSDVVYYEAYVEHNGTSFKLHAQQGAGDKKDSEDVSYVYLQNEKTCKILVLYDTDEDFIVTEEMIDEFVNREESISSYFTIDVPEGYKLGRFRVGLEGMFEGCLLYKEGEEEATYTKYSERHGGVFVCNDETEVFRYEDGSLSGIKYSAINNTLEPQDGFERIELLDGGQALIGRCELREYNDSLEYEKAEFWYIFIDCDMDKNCYMLYFNPNDFTREDVIETAKTVVFAE